MRLSKLAFLAALCTGTVMSAGVNQSSVWGQSPSDKSFGYETDDSIVYESMGDQSFVDYPMGGAPMGNGGAGDCCEDEGGLFDQSCLSNGGSLGDPYKLLGECNGFSMGGWVQLGYHNKNLSSFNSRKNEYQLHQAWVYAEKSIDTTDGFDIGGRFDYIYGTDGPDTQAFGVDTGSYDTGWDNGADYGHALPQAYLEAGYGDWSVKVGHFFTLIGYEVVPATGNFFYSHAYTMYNSEPFTHSGALATYSMSEDIDIFGGYVLGWDSGFDDNGDAVIGGSSVQLTDDVNVTSTFVAGRFNDRVGRSERGFMSSTVAQVQLTEKLSYVFQTDLLDTEDAAGDTDRKTFDINQYLFRTINDYVQLGGRFEWWQVQADSSGFGLPTDAPGDYDIYAMTLGMNVKPHANVTVRPEIRWDWVYGDKTQLAAADFQLLEDNATDQTTFGIDTIITY